MIVSITLFELIILHFELFWAFSLYILGNSVALSHTGIGIRFLIAAANRIVLHRTNTIFFDFFRTIFFCTTFSSSHC
ncbi:MAG: hypothetical protein K0S23_1037 [Fluviicola sp.]|nr:hypothetical protein [Fluviicola sp.]